jgi:hypothetical protein
MFREWSDFYLLVGVRNAWDLVTCLAPRQTKPD